MKRDDMLKAQYHEEMDHNSYEMKLARQCGQLQSHMAYLHLRLSLASRRGLTPAEVEELAEVAQKSWAASRDELDKEDY